MKRWITEERVTELERMGRLRDNVTKNGHMDTNGLGNVEFVTVTSGRVQSHGDTHTASVTSARVAPLTDIDAVGNASCKATVSTVQCREGGAVNQPARAVAARLSTSSARNTARTFRIGTASTQAFPIAAITRTAIHSLALL